MYKEDICWSGIVAMMLMIKGRGWFSLDGMCAKVTQCAAGKVAVRVRRGGIVAFTARAVFQAGLFLAIDSIQSTLQCFVGR